MNWSSLLEPLMYTGGMDMKYQCERCDNSERREVKLIGDRTVNICIQCSNEWREFSAAACRKINLVKNLCYLHAHSSCSELQVDFSMKSLIMTNYSNQYEDLLDEAYTMSGVFMANKIVRKTPEENK